MVKKNLGLILFAIFISSCGHLFYYPSDKVFFRPKKLGISYNEFWMLSNDGVKLNGWHLKSKLKSKGVILHFHGNAQNMTSHFLNVAWLVEKGYDVLTFDYRGYGKSEGTPDQKGTYKDALTFLNYGVEFADKHKLKKVIVIAQSIGGAIALSALPDFKRKIDLDLIVVDSTFSSYRKIAFDKLLSSWVSVLFSPLAYVLIPEAFDTEARLNQIQRPLLVIHGKNDPVVPYKFGKEIFDQYPHQKWLWTVESEGHTDVFWRKEVDYRGRFLRLLKEIN